MKINIRQWLLVTAATASLASCFKDEPANAECDIEKAWLHFDNPGACVWSLNDTIQEDSALINRDLIVFRVKPGTDRSQLAPMFALTPGATIRPANGTTSPTTPFSILSRRRMATGNVYTKWLCKSSDALPWTSSTTALNTSTCTKCPTAAPATTHGMRWST